MANGRLSVVPVAIAIVCLVASQVPPTEPGRALEPHRIVVEGAKLAPDEIVDILVIDGRIQSIGKVERRDRDVVVRAGGGRVVAGRRRTLANVPDWSELVGGPSEGLTSVVLPLDPAARQWLEGVRRRAAWAGPRLADAAEAGTQPRVSPGFPAELLVLDPVSDALSQAVIGDEVLRRADLETRREMIADARRGLAMLPEPEPGLRSLRVDAAGLAVGRIDLRPDGRIVHERTVAPHPSERRWEIDVAADGWTVTLRDSTGLLAKIRRHGSVVTAETPMGQTLRLERAEGLPSIDPMALAASESAALLRLPEGGELDRPVVELTITDEGISITPDRIRFLRMPGSGFPLGLRAGERAFRLTSPSGREALFVLDFAGFPTRGWETAPAGDVEWIGRPIVVETSPETARSATKPP